MSTQRYIAICATAFLVSQVLAVVVHGFILAARTSRSRLQPAVS